MLFGCLREAACGVKSDSVEVKVGNQREILGKDTRMLTVNNITQDSVTNAKLVSVLTLRLALDEPL